MRRGICAHRALRAQLVWENAELRAAAVSFLVPQPSSRRARPVRSRQSRRRTGSVLDATPRVLLGSLLRPPGLRSIARRGVHYHGDLRQFHRRNRAWRSKRRLCVEQLSGTRAPTRCLQTRRNQRELLGLTYRIGLMAIAPPRVSDGEGSSTRSDVAPKCCRCYGTNSSAL